MTLRTDEELDAALTELAERQGISKQEAARRAILETADRKRHKAAVAAASSASRERWASVLDRLGTV